MDRAAIRDLSAEVEWAKVSMLTPETYLARARATGRGTPGGMELDAVARLLQAYEDVKTERGAMDFEDVLLLTVGILDERDDVAETVRRQYRTFTVDEYQDVSVLQQRLLDLWTGGRSDVCVVGDASQTIYSFTGASPQHLLGFRAKHPDAKLVRLVRDYRSTPQVVALANGVLDRAPASATRARVQLVSQREAGPTPGFTGYDDDVAEAAGVAASIRALIASGVPAAEIAVLYRTNGQSEAYEQALSDAGVGYLLKGGQRFFSRPEVRQAMVLLRGSQRSDDGSTPLGDLVRDVLASSGWAPEPPSASGAVRDRWASLQALAQLADDVAAARPDARMPELVAELTERDAAQHAPAVQGVTLASLHAAKGLEWDAVLPRRPDRGPDAHLVLLRRPRRRGGGATPDVRRRHPRPHAPGAVLGAGAHPRRAGHAQALAVPGRPAPGGDLPVRDRRSQRPGGGQALEGRPGARVPLVREGALHRRRAQGRGAARTARPPTTRPSSSDCGPGARPPPPRPRCPRTWSSPTPRWWPSASWARATPSPWPPSPGWDRPSWSATGRPSSPCSPTPDASPSGALAPPAGGASATRSRRAPVNTLRRRGRAL